jgi:hypothetical protein
MSSSKLGFFFLPLVDDPRLPDIGLLELLERRFGVFFASEDVVSGCSDDFEGIIVSPKTCSLLCPRDVVRGLILLTFETSRAH